MGNEKEELVILTDIFQKCISRKKDYNGSLTLTKCLNETN